MSPCRNLFTSFETLENPHDVHTADKAMFKATGIGEMSIKVPNRTKNSNITLKNVLYVPNLTFTLVSIACCDTAGFSCTFGKGKCILRDPKGQICGEINKIAGLYRSGCQNSDTNLMAFHTTVSVNDLHSRMGHISPAAAKQMVESGAVEGVELDNTPILELCDACIKGRITRSPISKERLTERSNTQGQKIHTDVWGPAQTQSLGGNKWYITFTDDYTRETFTYLMRNKSEAFSKYQEYEAFLKQQRNIIIKKLQSDRGGEYLSNEFKLYT
jgi:hypothetical protein